MAKSDSELGVVSFLIICFYISACNCTCEPDAPSVDDYFENISAHYKNELQMLDAQVTQMEFAFEKELSIVGYNQELAAKVGRQLESRMRSTATLNSKGKLCIKHFMANVTMENFNLQTKLRACFDAGKAAANNIGLNARNQVRNSRTQLNDLVNADLTLCRKNNGNNAQKLTDCAKEKLKIREINVQSQMKVTSKEIEAVMCRADTIARTAQECSFLATLDTQSLLSEMVGNINVCIGDRILEIK